MHTPRPVGKWETLAREMKKHPGKKVIFFYIGYAGQDFEYEARDDPKIVVATMKGERWAAGGDNHLGDSYVADLVDKTHAETSCYYYWVQGSDAVVNNVFAPRMKQLGYVELPQPVVPEVRAWCRAL
jgi:hypothetical protein